MHHVIDVCGIDLTFPDQAGHEVVGVFGMAQGLAEGEYHLDANVVLHGFFEHGLPSGLVEDVETDHDDVPEVVLEPPAERDVSHVFVEHEKGDLEAGFAAADVVIEQTYVTQRQHQVSLEPQAVLIHIDDRDGRVHVWLCSKMPYNTRESLATAVGISESQILFHHAFIGGDFGGKGNARNTPICYALAKAIDRLVRIVADDIEALLAGNPRHATLTTLKTGVTHNGRLTADQVRIIFEALARARVPQ